MEERDSVRAASRALGGWWASRQWHRPTRVVMRRGAACMTDVTSVRAFRRCGFTLVELAVVVVIVGLVTALVFARIESAIPSGRLRSTAAEIVAAARFARTATRLRRTEVLLEYDLDRDVWAVSTVIVGEDEEQVPPGGLEPEVLLSGALPRGIRIAAVHYSEDGLAEDGIVTCSMRPSGAVGEHMVVLEDDSGAVAGVFVPALTGAAFLVEDGSTYAGIRETRRLE